MNPVIFCRVIGGPDRIPVNSLLQQRLPPLVPWSFFNAPQQCSLRYDRNRAEISYRRPLTPAQISCFRNHMAVLAEFMRTDIPFALILEDDVLIDPFLDVHELCRTMDRAGIHFMQLFMRRYVSAKLIGSIGHRQVLRLRTPAYGTQAYIVDREGAKRFLRSIKRIERPIDDELGRFWAHSVPLYALLPAPALELGVPSTVPQFKHLISPSGTVRARVLWRRILEKCAKHAANLSLARTDQSVAYKL